MDIPAEFRKNGFRYTLYRAGGRSCIYAQLHEQKPIGFEVFEIRQTKEREKFGKLYPTSFRIPGNGDFGVWAWSCSTPERAMERFTELENCDTLCHK